MKNRFTSNILSLDQNRILLFSILKKNTISSKLNSIIEQLIGPERMIAY